SNAGPTAICVASTDGGSGAFCRRKWDNGISVPGLGLIWPENKTKPNNQTSKQTKTPELSDQEKKG
ncbi:hypothetical protein ACQP3D_29050, partial [Escherichia coli]